MKKKIILTAILVCAAVGGAMVVKAHRFNTAIFCGNAQNNCPNFTPSRRIVATTNVGNLWCGVAANACPVRVIVIVDP